MPQPISNQQFGSQSMTSTAGSINPNIGKVVTGANGAQFDFTQAKIAAPKTPMPSVRDSIGKVVTMPNGAQFDFTQAKMAPPKVGAKTYGADGIPTSGSISSNRYPKETWQNYTSRPNSRWAQVHGGTLDRSDPTNPILKPFNNTPKPVGMG